MLPKRTVLSLMLLMFVTKLWAQGPMYHVGVDGLTCPFCAYGIEKQLTKLEGVKEVKTDVKEGVVLVTMQDDKFLDRSQIEKAVKKAGFSLRSFGQKEAS